MYSRTLSGRRFVSQLIAAIAGLALLARPTLAATYDESITGDLPDNPASPQTLTLTLGTNSILGSIGSGAGADALDAIAITVPAGMMLTAFTHSAYTSSIAQEFIGFQPGAAFSGSPGVNSNYAG